MNGRQLVYIGGAGRSGSTLLDLLLNNHGDIQSVGEIHRLAWYAQSNREPCTCGENVLDCPFWLKVQALAEEHTTVQSKQPLLATLDPMMRPGDLSPAINTFEKAVLLLGSRPLFKTFLKTLAPKHHDALENSLFWNEMIRKTTGKPIILDSTKDARRLRSLYLFDPEPFKLIFLVRDGRGVAASAMRREGQDMASAADDWVDSNRRSLAVQRGIPSSKICFLRYEDLCREPEESLQRVCDFIGVSFSSQMLSLDKGVSHNIGGNPMRFRQGEQRIVLDEAWRKQLTTENLLVFERIAGTMNKRFGYIVAD